MQRAQSMFRIQMQFQDFMLFSFKSFHSAIWIKNENRHWHAEWILAIMFQSLVEMTQKYENTVPLGNIF